MTFHVTPDEWQALWRRAALARQPLSDFLLAAALAPPAPAPVPVAAIRLYGRLGRAAVELDQAVRRARGEPGAAGVVPRLVQLAAELRDLRRQLAGLPPLEAPDGPP
jgi:hypothetical protein